MKRRQIINAGILCLVITFMAMGCKKDSSSTNTSTTLNTTDQAYMAQAAEANKAEIDAGQTASTKATNTGIRSFGQFMVTEHTTSKNCLDSLASAVKFTISDTLSPEHQALKNTLASLTGRSFDSTYIASQVSDHQKVITLFQNIISNATDQGLKNYANQYLPHIQMHYTMADSLRRNL